MEQYHIDGLLERYLTLLDEYTRLRQSLSQLQSGVYQNIARANFSGERGMRYGQDRYDERMQAIRLLTVGVDEETQVPKFSMMDVPREEGGRGEEEAKETQHDGQDGIKGEAEGKETEKGTTEHSEKEDDEKTEKQKKRKKPRNPLYWFGLFAPMPLRTAQTQSIQAVEQIIPRLVTVNAEMRNVEIEVRRARKRRAKAETAERKKNESDPQPQSQTTPIEAA